MKVWTIIGLILVFTGIVVGALNIEASRYGYAIILPGTALLSTVGYAKNDAETFLVFFILTIINIVGVFRWLIIT